MAEISASMVMKLRKMSGQGMMDCKKALAEANGDLDQAMEILRKKGLATLAKRAGRETSEGIVVAEKSQDGKTAVIAALCCETDFVAKSNDFTTAAEKLVEYALACQETEGTENLLETSVDGKKFADVLTELVSTTGEKIQLGDYAKYTLDGTGVLGVYVHFNKKLGAMIQISANDDKVAGSDIIQKTADDLAMHITATDPLALDENGIDAEIIEREKSIYADQVKNKPPEIIEKIIQGKVKKFLAEKCLLAQAFVKDDSVSISELVDKAGKEASGQAQIARFVRFGVG